MTEQVLGYAEGYYGRLLTWSERRVIIESLSSNGQNTYYYAPKEDVLHRWQWRTAYPDGWVKEFASFCAYAKQHGICVVAGVAPGLDFNFKDLPGGLDYQSLFKKFHTLRQAGADQLSLLLDDIDEDFHRRSGRFVSEGLAHATLANTLAEDVGLPLWVTPRVYADELIISDPTYLPDFLGTLKKQHTVLYCGSDVVSKHASVQSLQMLCETLRQTQGAQSEGLSWGAMPYLPSNPLQRQRATGRAVLWDNLYANDYCPRRLFIGPWQGRSDVQDALLNPTGMIHTDCLLLELMAANKGFTDNSVQALQTWRTVLKKHGVPDAFFELTPYFYHPVFNSDEELSVPKITLATFDAIEHCLWRWKSPLSREWYGYIFGLKHDLLLEKNQLPNDRICKTQNAPLARRLLERP